MAYVIPVRTKPGRGPQVLIIVLTKENLERMREGDPFDLQTRAYADQLDLDQRVGALDIIVAYEEDPALLDGLARAGDLNGIIQHLERGRKHRPGDATPPVPIKDRPR
jgi:hypothetical protein